MIEEDIQASSSVLDLCKWLPAKVNIHAWRLEMDRVPTTDALKRRNVIVGDSRCILCNFEEETAEHMFTACYIASNVWQGISSWCKIPSIYAFSIKDLFSFHKNLRVSDKKNEAVQGIIMIACWSLWRARNNAKFSNISVRIENVVSEIKAMGFLWFFNRFKNAGIEWREWCSFVDM
ncbi:uncharacterized protein LOC110882050 [Helianthus annuus]|uniref:uncharacterized protein LOC110882050 n=1 Tax=Helianthus annuus TaxID=4232 RepID=UPI000B8FF955|nr:uncharacterized protein LOC110882050 [Helianthus annuus]